MEEQEPEQSDSPLRRPVRSKDGTPWLVRLRAPDGRELIYRRVGVVMSESESEKSVPVVEVER